jgi:outer membrane protein assembly factor BamB
MRYFHLLTLVCATLALTAFAGAADWPQLHGPNGDRTTPETGINKDWVAKPPIQDWKMVLGDGGWAGMSIVAGTVYVVDHSANNDTLRAINLTDGKEVWNLSYPMTGNFDSGGKTIATPTYDNGMLYIEARDGQILCVDIAKQAIVWNVSLKKDLGGNNSQYSYCASVTVDGDRVLVMPGGTGKALAALDKTTGKTIWIGGGDDKPGYAPVVIANYNGVKQYVCMGAKSVFSADAATGKQLWSIVWPGGYDIQATTPMVVGKDGLFITTGYGKPSAYFTIGADGPKQVWKNGNIVAKVNQPVIVDGYIYSTGEQNNLICEDVATGTKKWSSPQSFEQGGVIAIDGTLIVVNGSNGDISLVKLTPDAFTELGKVQGLGGQSWAPPAFADGYLLVRNQKAMAAYKLK